MNDLIARLLDEERLSDLRNCNRHLVASDMREAAAVIDARDGLSTTEVSEALDRLTVASNSPWQVNNEDWIDVRANDLLVVLTAIFKARGEA
jgi:hypothetical protein